MNGYCKICNKFTLLKDGLCKEHYWEQYERERKEAEAERDWIEQYDRCYSGES